MKHKFYIIILVFSSILFVGCRSLKAPIIQQNESISAYSYFYMIPSSELTSSSGEVFGSGYGVYGTSYTKSINPSEVISGIMLKNGFVRLPEIDQKLLDKTLIVNYGESGRRDKLFGYTIEVTIQFLSAKTYSVVCICTAEGMGSTEADDIRIAINRALGPLFIHEP